jgi:oligopeptide transport system permease protein
MIRTREAYLAKVMARDGRTEYNAAEQQELEAMRAAIETNPIHQRVYILGTDILGRDMLSRTIYGGRISIGIGVLGSITALFIGIFFGSVAGYAGGRLDNLIMRFVDVMYGLPYMLIVIILMAIVGRNVFILFVAIALVSWLTIARVVRGQIISLKNSEFVQAAQSVGAGTPRIIQKHLLPNTLGIIIVYATLSLPQFIMNESFLSFLGLGVSAPLASWGSLVSDGVKGMELYPWLLIGPAVVMTVFLFAMNFLGDGLRDSFDPQSKNRT